MQVEKIVSGKLRNNTYVVYNKNNECLLVDCSCSLEEIISRTKNAKVLGVLLTHGHYDQFCSLDQVLEHFKINCYVHNLDFEKLFNPKSNYSIVFNKIYSVKTPKENFVLLDNNNNSFKLGNFNIKFFQTPGHTNGSVCYLINDEFLFTGDTLFSNCCGRCDLITGNEQQMEESLKFLTKKFSNSKFYPGHGSLGELK